ncbi:MAG: SpoIIE family protein phosphatase [Bryobacteraceae bacterium]|jgi:phosphoserine phosphatase RsbU/P
MGESAAALHLSIHAINVYVRDQDRSLRFYVDQLGFNLAFDGQLQSGSRWVAVTPPDGSTVLSLVAPKKGSRESAFIGRATHIVFVSEDVLAQFHQWRLRGVHFTTSPRLRRVKFGAGEGRSIWGGVFARFKDADGNSFVLAGYDEFTNEVARRRNDLAARLEAERRAAQELDIATRVQARLFPQLQPAVSTLEYAGICIQARQVGGDYYDFLDLGRERLGLVIGDIAGKGMAAALLMANLQANLRSQCALAWSRPREFMQSVNRLFCQSTADGAYATLFFAEYNGRTRRLRFVNCGHLCALVLRSGGSVERLHSNCTVLGLFEEWDCEVGECRLRRGDTLALYTDGVTESFNAAEEEFGEPRLVEALQRNAGAAPPAMAGAIVDELRAFSPHEQHDDVTLIVARCK